MPNSNDNDTVLIIGAGLAGLFLALKLAPMRVRVMSPAPLGEAAASAWAQGGFAAALGPEDDPKQHADDTVACGAGLVDPTIARLIAEAGPACVRELIGLGVPFDRSADGSLSLSLEAAHSRARVARVKGDLAGKAIMQSLIAATRAADHVTLMEGVRLEGLQRDPAGRVCGALTRDGSGHRAALSARHVVLATGGTGGLYAVTTNPPSARGDGLAAAMAVGAALADMEFVQFHPTAIDVGRDPAPLATEALRGEGARLVNSDGASFMMQYHPQGDLAPRDVVVRAIHTERQSGRGAFLDARQAVGRHFPQEFPSVFDACMLAGIDPRTQPIPIAPAAHYHMGGILSDAWGQSSVDGLSVLGECASTGAHGANRLASNSLLEAAAFAGRIAERLLGTTLAASGTGHGEVTPDAPVAAMASLRLAMSAHAGVVRTTSGLTSLLALIDETIAQHGRCGPFVISRTIAQCALARQESRGAHFRSDFPEMLAQARRSFTPGLAGD
ncbi:MAG: L-aspartate oxidase [Caulobacterales bacterium]